MSNNALYIPSVYMNIYIIFTINDTLPQICQITIIVKDRS